MSKKRLVLGTALLFLTSCTSVENKSIPGIPLSATELVYEDTSRFMTYPYKIRLADSLVFILDLHAGDGAFVRVLSYPALKYITSIGRKGRGPYELVTLPCFDIYKDSVYLLDPHKMILMRYSVRRIAEGSDKPDTCVYYPTGFSPVLNYKVTPRGLFIIHNSKERSFVELSASDTMPLLKVELPDYVDVKRRSVLEQYMTSLWNSSIAYQEEPKIAVNVSQLGDLLEIYKQGHDGIISIIGEGGVPDVIREGGRISIGKVDGFSDVQIFKNRIYALYSGADRKEMIELARQGKNVPDGSDKLLVYDFDGTMLRKYTLNRRVNGFDIDTVNQVLVMVNSNTEAPMYTFPLPEGF